MTPLETELEHLLNMLAPPWTAYWREFCWCKATYLARERAEDYAGLPEMLAKAMKERGSPASSASGPNL